MSQVVTEPTQTDSTSTAVQTRGERGQNNGLKGTASAAPARGTAVTRLERYLGRRLLTAMGDPPVQLILWDGTTVASRGGDVRHRIRLRDRRSFWKLVYNPMVQFGETYSDAALEVQGDLVDLLTDVYHCLDRVRPSRGPWTWLARSARRLTGSTLASARKSIHHHYDIGNDFYRQWLDDRLLYTCAYFAEPSWSLERAQVAKMDHVCRKVRLGPGDTVVEAGCGWGGFALHMAKHYGAKVRAFNISREQIRYARHWVQREGLADRVEFIQDDWRNIRGQYDVFLSIGMLEHVGPRNYHRLGQVMDRCLKLEGRGLLHAIGRDQPAAINRWIAGRIFPGAYAPTLGEMTRVLEPFNFSVLDVENLRLHYAQTLRHWLDRYEQSADQVGEMFDPRFVRMWRLYLAGSMVAFQTGSLQLFQVLFQRGHSNQIPRTRAHLYGFEGQSRNNSWTSATS